MSARNIVKSIQDIMRQDVGVDGDAQRLSQLCWMFFLKIIDDQDQQLAVMQDNYRSPIPEQFQWRTWAANPEGITGDVLMTFINTELFPALKELPTTGKNANRVRVVRSVFEDAYNYMKSGQLMRQVVNKISGVDFNDLAERKHFGDIYEQLLNDLQSAGNAGEYYTPRAVTAFMVDRIDPKPGEILFDPSCGTGGFLTCAIRHMRDRYVKKIEDEQALQAGLRAVEKKQLPHMLCVTNMLLHGIEDPSFVRHDNTLARPYISYGSADRVDIILTNPPFGGREEDGIESNFPAHFRTKETADLFLALFIRLLKPGGRAAIVLPDGSLFGEGVKTRLKEHLLQECNLHTIVRLPNSVFKPYASIGTNLLFFEKGEPTQNVWFYEHQVPAGQKAYSMTRPIKVEHLNGCVDWWGGAGRENRQETAQAWKVGIDEIKARNYNLDFKNPHTVADDHGDPQELLAQLNTGEAQAAALRDQLKKILVAALPGEARFHFDNLQRLISQPEHIKLLRKTILNLAVRGRLVPQDPNDEPAAKLLKRIQAEKSRLVKEGKIKEPKGLASSITNPPYVLPANWQWIPLGVAVNSHLGGGTPSKNNSAYWGGNIYWASVKDIGKGKYVDETIDRITEAGLASSSSNLIPPGNLIVVTRMGLGKISINRVPIAINQDLRALSLSSLASIDYYYDFFKTHGFEGSGLTVKGIKVEELLNVPFPLPPLVEQHRIVAKVDELMALCDELEAQLIGTQHHRLRLLEAVLHAAVAATV